LLSLHRFPERLSLDCKRREIDAGGRIRDSTDDASSGSPDCKPTKLSHRPGEGGHPRIGRQ
jgi:hypothetical protein